jgi:mannosyltransferase
LTVAPRGQSAVARVRSVARTSDAAVLVVAALSVAVFVFRLTQVHQSLFGDEVFTYQDVVGKGLAGVVKDVHTGAENSPPLFFVLAWASAKLGNPTVWIRLPSLILGAATIPLIYLVGRATVGRTAGVIGAAIVVCSPFSTYYGIEARPYATMAFFLTLSTLSLVRAVQTGQRRWWVAYALAAAAAAYSHYTAVFVLAVQAAWSLWVCRRRALAPLAANALILLLYVPWLPYVRGKQLGVIGLLEPLNAHNVLTDLGRLIPGYPYASLRAIPTIAGLVALAACALVGLAYGARILAAPGPPAARNQWREFAALIVVAALAAPVGLLLYSVLGTDIWDARDLYSSVPAAALVCGALLAAVPWPWRAGLVTLVLAVLVAGSIRAIGPNYARPQFRAAAQFLDRAATPRDPIVMYGSVFNVDYALVIQMTKPHLLVGRAGTRWPVPPPGGFDYVVIDDAVARFLRIGIPRPSGFELVDRRHYTGVIPFSLLTYRPLGA